MHLLVDFFRRSNNHGLFGCISNLRSTLSDACSGRSRAFVSVDLCCICSSAWLLSSLVTKSIHKLLDLLIGKVDLLCFRDSLILSLTSILVCIVCWLGLCVSNRSLVNYHSITNRGLFRRFLAIKRRHPSSHILFTTARLPNTDFSLLDRSANHIRCRCPSSLAFTKLSNLLAREWINTRVDSSIWPSKALAHDWHNFLLSSYRVRDNLLLWWLLSRLSISRILRCSYRARI